MTKFNKCNFRQKHKNTCYYIMNINLEDRCHKNHIYRPFERDTGIATMHYSIMIKYEINQITWSLISQLVPFINKT